MRLTASSRKAKSFGYQQSTSIFAIECFSGVCGFIKRIQSYVLEDYVKEDKNLKGNDD